MKIDVEGYEKFVLQGAISMLDKTKYIYFEAWDEHCKNNGYTFRELFDLLKSKKFNIAKIDIPSNCIHEIQRDAEIPVCMNLLAYRDRKELEMRTGWTFCSAPLKSSRPG